MFRGPSQCLDGCESCTRQTKTSEPYVAVFAAAPVLATWPIRVGCVQPWRIWVKPAPGVHLGVVTDNYPDLPKHRRFDGVSPAIRTRLDKFALQGCDGDDSR